MLLHDGVMTGGPVAEDFANVCGMQPLVEVAQDANIGFFKGLLLKGMMVASEHPVYTGLVAGIVGMAVVFSLRKALWATTKFALWGLPTGILGVAFSPIVGLVRKFRNRTSFGGLSHRLPLIGERACIGPCDKCGTKREYAVRTTAYYGGSLRGVDTMTGATVIGCSGCTRC